MRTRCSAYDAIGLRAWRCCWTSTPLPMNHATEQQRAQHELAGQILRDNQWRVIDVPRGMGVADAWSALEQLNTAA